MAHKTTTLLLFLLFVFALTACGPAGTGQLPPAEHSISLGTQPLPEQTSTNTTAGDLVYTLSLSSASYSGGSPFSITAMVEYTGLNDSVTLGHGLPFVGFALLGEGGNVVNQTAIATALVLDEVTSTAPLLYEANKNTVNWLFQNTSPGLYTLKAYFSLTIEGQPEADIDRILQLDVLVE